MLDIVGSYLRQSWSVGSLAREVLTKEKSMKLIRDRLFWTPLFSPTYITLAASTSSLDAITIVRDINSFVSYSNDKYVVQTNHDPWLSLAPENILYSIQRRKICEVILKGLSKHPDAEITLDHIIQLFMVDYINNEETIYAFISNVTKGEIVTYVP